MIKNTHSEQGEQRSVLEQVGSLDKCWKVVDGIAIIPLPAKDDLLICLDITQRKDAKSKHLRVSRLGRLATFIITLGAGTDHRAKDGVGTATAANEACLIARESCVQRHVEGWAEEVHEWLWHAMVRVGVERV
jgi:hypothetical protein